MPSSVGAPVKYKPTRSRLSEPINSGSTTRRRLDFDNIATNFDMNQVRKALEFSVSDRDRR
jgi:hypothetical protein